VNERLFTRLSQIVDGQKKLADSLHISPNTVSSWKTRGTSPPSKYIPQIAEFIGVSAEWLLTGKESDLPSKAELSERALSFAQRFDALDEDGRFVVGNALVQEERRIASDKKEVIAQ